MKTIRVMAAIIADNLEQPIKIFIPDEAMENSKTSEFPGGKVETEKTPEAACAGKSGKFGNGHYCGTVFGTVEYDYLTFHLSSSLLSPAKG